MGCLGFEADSPFALDSYRVGEDVCEIRLFYSQAVFFFFSFFLILDWGPSLLLNHFHIFYTLLHVI